MANKQTNKQKSNPAEFECCGQDCNNHENMKQVPVEKTCRLDNQIVFGFILILGGVFLILNAFVFPLL